MNLRVVHHPEVYFPYWENESPGDEIELKINLYQKFVKSQVANMAIRNFVNRISLKIDLIDI